MLSGFLSLKKTYAAHMYGSFVRTFDMFLGDLSFDNMQVKTHDQSKSGGHTKSGGKAPPRGKKSTFFGGAVCFVNHTFDKKSNVRQRALNVFLISASGSAISLFPVSRFF